MTAKSVLLAQVVVAVSLALYGRGASAEDAEQKAKVTVISGRGNEAGRIVEKDGTVKELTRDQLTFKNTANDRVLEANDQRAQKLADDAKKTSGKKDDAKKEDPKKPGAKKADDAKKTADDAAADKKKADAEKKNADDAEKKKEKAAKAYNDKAYDYSGAAYIPDAKKKSLSDISLESDKTPPLTGTPKKFAPIPKDSTDKDSTSK